MESYFRNIGFTTTNNEQDLLTIKEVKDIIEERLNISNEEYEQIKKNNGFDMYVNVFCSSTKISINDGIYNDLLENVIYSTGEFYNGIKSIKVKDTNITGILSFRLR